MSIDDPDLLGTQMVPRNFTQEVLAEIGRVVMQNIQGRPELADEIFKAVISKFENRYPHHKILSGFRGAASEAKLVSDDSNIPPGTD